MDPDDRLLMDELQRRGLSVAVFAQLIFFEGRYSHAVAKKPFDSVLEVGDARSAATEATPAEVEVATRAVEAVPGFLPYTRGRFASGRTSTRRRPSPTLSSASAWPRSNS